MFVFTFLKNEPILLLKKNNKRYFFRLFVFRFVFLQNFQFSVVSVICPTHHLSYISFVPYRNQKNIICHTLYLSYTVCPTPYLSYTSFVLQRGDKYLFPKLHLSYTSFVLHIICSTPHLS